MASITDKSLKEIIIKHSDKLETKQASLTTRGSKFIGVSKNTHGNWQVIFKYERKRVYMGSTKDLTRAAMMHDLVMI